MTQCEQPATLSKESNSSQRHLRHEVQTDDTSTEPTTDETDRRAVRRATYTPAGLLLDDWTEATGLSNRQVAARAEVHPASVTRIKQGTLATTPFGTLERYVAQLGHLLGRSPDALMAELRQAYRDELEAA